MNKVVLGKYVNTHGIKGEIRIKSSFKYKDLVFKKGNEIIIDKPYIIMSHRFHKGYDMVLLDGINSINDIIHLKNSLVYIDRDKYLHDGDYLDSDLIGLQVICNNKEIGYVSAIRPITEKKKLLMVNNIMIPMELIENVNLDDKKIIIKYVEGLV